MNAAHQLRVQAKYALLSFRRNPAATFFTIILPLIFLLLFTSIFGNEQFSNGARVATFYVPGILAMSVIASTMINLAITTVTRRENGILKRIRGTPLRPWVYIAGQVAAALVITAVMTVLVVGLGWMVFDVSVQASGIFSMAISLVIGSAAFSALGLAMTVIIPNEKAAPAVTNLISLPLYFVSDVFIISEDTPSVIRFIGNLFPIKHFAAALGESFNPFLDGSPFPWKHWLVIAGWGSFAALVAAKRFRWTA